jgi:hypothetical protein
MRKVLLILTRSVEPLNDVVTAAERSNPENQITVADLTVENPDYPELLRAIFEADSVQVW